MQLVEPRPRRPLPIRLTPLIDVVFILLVFFMLTSRLTPVHHLELATVADGSGSVDTTPVPTITVVDDRRLHWPGHGTYDLAGLIAQLQRQGITDIHLATGDDTPLSAFTLALTTLDQAGIRGRWQRPKGGQ